MDLKSIIILCYFFIGLALGFLIIHLYDKHLGDGNPFVIVGFVYLNMIGWPLIFPILLSGLVREIRKFKKKGGEE